MKIFDFLKTNDYNETFRTQEVMTNGFVLNRDKSLQIYFCVKRQAKNDFLKDVESTVGAVTILKEVVWYLQICNSCFYQVSESWPMGLLFKKQ